MAGHTILVVDDDPHIREVLCFALDRAGMATETAKDGASALARFGGGGIDLIVLDVGLPEKDGLELCRDIRRVSEVPILFLSARDEEIDRILGLEIGGDDYVTKPFSPREVVARVKTILKRYVAAPSTEAAHGKQALPGLTIEAEARLVSFEGNPVALTGLEFEILSIFAARPRQVFTRGQIMQAAYGGDFAVSDRTVDSHIRNIRAKLADAGCSEAITTVHGIGFRLGGPNGIGA
ncbi:response regulator transcription factor [Cucumibacter marinus]|uniref:response regulator transcription factor n=1 Tax=Cucumibacter marinus TaxID=1121252 RepID=UPI00048D60A8|nr:response regulator transcription factor [Cucumibacter marinus]